MRANKQQGLSLLEPLIAIVIMAFGVLGLAKFQLNMFAQTGEAKARLNATTLAEELLSQVLVDTPNAVCYATTVSPAVACGSTQASAVYAAWKANAISVLGTFAGKDKSGVTATSSLNSTTSQLTVTLTWRLKNSSGNQVSDTHTHTVITDVHTF